MQDFRKLYVWQDAYRLVLDVYRMSRAFPPEERYGLQSQLRRAAISVTANIAEGCGRDSQGELRHFLSIASGSAAEVTCHIMLARDLDFLNPAAAERLLSKNAIVRRKLNKLIQTVKANNQ